MGLTVQDRFICCEKKLYISPLHDFVALRPFEGASDLHRAALIAAS